VLNAEIRLASIAVVRSLSLAVLQSKLVYANDDKAELLGLPGYFGASGDQPAQQNVSYSPTRAMIGGLSELEAKSTRATATSAPALTSSSCRREPAGDSSRSSRTKG